MMAGGPRGSRVSAILGSWPGLVQATTTVGFLSVVSPPSDQHCLDAILPIPGSYSVSVPFSLTSLELCGRDMSILQL